MSKPTRKNEIPLHFLKEENDLGIFIHRIDQIDEHEAMTMGAHRDDHCNLFFQEKGNTSLMVDFREVRLDGCGIFCVLPGQVHFPLTVKNTDGWFLAVDMASLKEEHRAVFEEYVLYGEPVILTEQQALLLRKCMELLQEISSQSKNTSFKRPVFRSMLQVCIGVFAGIFREDDQVKNSVQSRPVAITRAFKHSLLKNFKTVKSPSVYAQLLNISASYLNEVVKESSGFSVSYWIQKEVITEAKRLLYFTDLSVKEIAFALGYEDHTYFSRLFSKNVKCSPGQFRSKYRE